MQVKAPMILPMIFVVDWQMDVLPAGLRFAVLTDVVSMELLIVSQFTVRLLQYGCRISADGAT